VGTGNAEPWVGKFRGTKGLDNLYTCSIVAVRVSTGELAWHYQAVPNDNWDYDSVQQMTLADLSIGGRTRKVLMQASKNGFFYVLDRVTGEFISGEAFTQVNWAHGFDKAGRPQINPGAFYEKEGVEIFPTAGGAHNWSPMSFNPATGLVYIPTTYGSWTYAAGDEVIAAQTGHTGLARGFAQATSPSTLPMIGPERLGANRGVLEAWDPVAQKLVWRTPGGGGIGGGTLTTAGSLVFQVTNDGRLLAYTADKGEKLLEIPFGRFGAGPPITFLLDGKQQIALMAGSGRRPMPSGPNDAKVDNPPLLYVFALDAKTPLPVMTTPPPPATAPHDPAAPPKKGNR
jgi:quinohemoprotein ethanol dehydrogenase